MTNDNPHKILFVCTGNVCRSPAAEAILRHKAGEQGFGRTLFVDSAGTGDVNEDSAPTNMSVLEGGRRGYDLAQLRARKIRQNDLAEFDFIVCMTQNHKQQIEDRFKAGKAELKLLSEFAPDDLPTDISDPWGGDADDYARTYDLLELGLSKLAILLRAKQAL